MRMRGDTKKNIYERLSNDEKEFKGIEKYADFIVNGNYNEKWQTIKNIIDKCEKVS